MERNAIHMQFLSYCNNYIRDLYTSDLDLDFDRIEEQRQELMELLEEKFRVASIREDAHKSWYSGRPSP